MKRKKENFLAKVEVEKAITNSSSLFLFSLAFNPSLARSRIHTRACFSDRELVASLLLSSRSIAEKEACALSWKRSPRARTGIEPKQLFKLLPIRSFFRS